MDEEIDAERLIALASAQRAIWDKAQNDYHSRVVKKEAWRHVCSELNAEFEAMSEKRKNACCKVVIKKWRNIRDQWAKACKKVAEQKKSGVPEKSLRYYIYHEQLSFLKTTITSKETEPSFNIGDDVSYTSDEYPEVNDYQQDQEISDKFERRRRHSANGGDEYGKKKRKLNIENLQSEDPKLYFFKSLLPTIDEFTGDETLQLQAGLIALVQNIKKARLLQIKKLL